MDFLTSTILSGIAYDMIKCGVLLSTDNLKEHLKNWIINDSELVVISNELNKLELNDEMSETAIEKRINNSELRLLLETIKPVHENNIINQYHSGTGDNVGRDKIINGK